MELLAGLHFLAHADRLELEDLAGALKRHTYKRGEVIYHQDDPPGNLFIVSSGMVKLGLTSSSGRNLTISWVLPAGFFGTTSLYGGLVRPENAVALEQTELFSLSRELLRAYLHVHPEAAEAMLEIMAYRWQRAIERLHDIAFLDPPARMAKLIWEFSHRPGIATLEPQPLLKNLTQPELAALVNTTRESVNKWLHYFERQGWIRLERGNVRVLERDALKGQII